jgi:Septum formation
VTKPGATSVYSLRAGDCLQNPGAPLGITTVTVVPCSQAHNAQVFAEFRVAGSGYPGTAALRQQSAQGCHARIAGNINQSLVTNSMTLQYLFPESQSWADGHRSITCLVVDSSADLTTSLLLH